MSTNDRGVAQEDLAFGYDGQFKSRELSFMPIASLDRPLKLSAFAFHLFGRTLEGVEAFDKDVRKDQKADFTWMIFMVSAQYAACNQFAECSARYVDSLVSCACMLPQELDAIRQQAVDYTEVSSNVEIKASTRSRTDRGIIGIIESVNERADDE
ncbi:hypothetical protein CGLO_01846 [Colletotrichum gloeosporioides Cg-14]|uniref:Uncharacterized protein n=1 Tax=Colletotrichum gloeosporioides (strain Cg-14) TaxID=1237896 RepID=T0M349_COLGC|nr:hypothetical protein CGLO_01846 [Colletotrichum gloeosporioides Cg-14]